MKINGIVEVVSSKFSSLKLEGSESWYGAFPGSSTAEEVKALKKGDTVEIEYKQKESKGRTYNNIVKLFVVEPSLSFPPTTSSSETRKSYAFPLSAVSDKRSMVRCNALNNAVELFIHLSSTKLEEGDFPFEAMLPEDRIISIAKRFERYTAGDDDMEEAVALKSSTTESLLDGALSGDTSA